MDEIEQAIREHHEAGRLNDLERALALAVVDLLRESRAGGVKPATDETACRVLGRVVAR